MIKLLKTTLSNFQVQGLIEAPPKNLQEDQEEGQEQEHGVQTNYYKAAKSRPRLGSNKIKL